MSITNITKLGAESSRRVAAFAQRLFRDSSGLAFIEFGYALPIFLGFGLVGLELTNVVLARQKTERIASTVADLIASNQVAPNERQIGDMFASVPEIAKPFDFGAGGNVIITAVLGIYDSSDDEVQNKVAWQRCMQEDSFASAFGSQWTTTNDIADGPEVTLPNSLELGQNQMVITAEVFYPYQSIISQSLVGFILPENNLFREVATFRTRGSAIMNVTPVTGQAMHAC